MQDRAFILLITLAGAGALLWYSRTTGGASVVASVTDSIAGALVNRGVRNCNPGNLERTSDVWNNSFTTQSACEAAGRVWDDRFVVFYTMADGERALGHDLDNAIAEGYNTPASLADHYNTDADPTNDTTAYAQNIANYLGLDVNAQFDPTQLPQITQAIMLNETGYHEDINVLTQAVYAA